MKYKICLLFSFLIAFYSLAICQNFNLNVYRFQNSCTKEITYSMTEPQTRWYLSPERAILGLSSRDNINSTSPQQIFQIQKVEYNAEKESYEYTFYDSKRNRNGIIFYFIKQNYLILGYAGVECYITYEFYRP